MTEKKTQNKFMFFENFWDAINQLSSPDREIACYEFCKYGITGQLPDDRSLAMFCLGVSASVQKYQGRGGYREGAGRKPKNQTLNINQKNQNNQNNQKIHKQQTETETEIEKESKEEYKEEKKIKNLRFGELNNVLLTEQQHKELSEKYPNLNAAIEKLDTWLGTSGSKHKNKNHYAYFKSNSWVWENLQKKSNWWED